MKGARSPAVFVVTGANRGIGLELARQLAIRGDRVIATARDPERARELGSLPVRVERLDLGDIQDVDEFARRLEDQPVDALINNAAIGQADSGVERLLTDELERAFRVNSIGPLLVARALLPNLRAGRGKRIVSLTSGLGSVSQNESGGWYGYRASKAALNQLIRTLAQELAPEGFTCVVLSPGWVQTSMGGSGATLTPGQSVAGMLRVIDGLSPADNSKFFDYRGKEVPW
ncbi:MAG TPA: SDR family oxidoreductase [Thermoanaerobaculia bacterium]|nr:SDR family oxidoreductase [Thermoanaerobaculia bacterium]